MDFNQELHKLVKSDKHVAEVRALLSRGEDPNSISFFGETLLHDAVKSLEDNPQTVQVLIDAGANADARNMWMCTPLHYSVVLRKREVFEILLQSTNYVNSKDQSGRTALHYAIDKKCISLFYTRFCVQAPDLQIVRKLLDHRFINVDETDDDEETALAWAVKLAQIEIVKMLLKKNASPNSSSSIHGHTILHLAAMNRDRYCTVALLLKKANLLALDRKGRSSLDIILQNQHILPDFEFTNNFEVICVKVIAFNYNAKKRLEVLIKRLELSEFLGKCWSEIARMKQDIIVNEFSVFDFFAKREAKSSFENPTWQIYKPMVERLVNVDYPEYFSYLFNRISKPNLYAVLDVTTVERYFNNECYAIGCEYKHLIDFLKVVRTGVLSEYLDRWDIFCLIAAFTSLKNRKYFLKYWKHECELIDLWDEYSEDHFN